MDLIGGSEGGIPASWGACEGAGPLCRSASRSREHDFKFPPSPPSRSAGHRALGAEFRQERATKARPPLTSYSLLSTPYTNFAFSFNARLNSTIASVSRLQYCKSASWILARSIQSVSTKTIR